MGRVDDLRHSGRSTGDVSGSGSVQSFDLMAPNGGWVTSITMGEKSDRPCSVEIAWKSVDNGGETENTVSKRIGNCDPPTARSLKRLEAGNDTPTTRAALNGLRVCQRRSNGRIKGLAVTRVRITSFTGSNAAVGDQGAVQQFKRRRCNQEDTTWNMCSRGKVLVGVQIRHEDGYRGSIKGLAPICARLRVEHE